MDTLKTRVLIKVAGGNITFIGSTTPIDVTILDQDVEQTEWENGISYQENEILMDDQDIENVIACFSNND